MKVDIAQKHGVIKWPTMPDGAGGFQAGDRVDIPIVEPIEFIVNHTDKHPPSDFVSEFMPIMSDRLVEAFRKAGVENFQTYRAILRNPSTGETWSSYQVVNILGFVACADLEHSTYSVLLPPALIFSHLVIDTKKADGALCFRLLESSEKIIVHYDVLESQMYDKEGDPLFDGVDFDPIDATDDIE